MNIQKYIKECYEIAQSKGFYPDDSKIEDHLMGIVSEIGEAYEAHRQGKFADWEGFKTFIKEDFDIGFESCIKDSFEDELADIFIRLFNLMAYSGFDDREYEIGSTYYILNKSSTDYMFLKMIRTITSFMDGGGFKAVNIINVMMDLLYVCEKLNIPIEKHIRAKIEYNKTREYLHGKEY